MLYKYLSCDLEISKKKINYNNTFNNQEIIIKKKQINYINNPVKKKNSIDILNNINENQDSLSSLFISSDKSELNNSTVNISLMKIENNDPFIAEYSNLK